MNNEKINSKIKLSNNSSVVILIFVIPNSEISVVLHSVVPNFNPHPFYLRIYFLLLFYKFSKSLNFGNFIIFQIKKLQIS